MVLNSGKSGRSCDSDVSNLTESLIQVAACPRNVLEYLQLVYAFSLVSSLERVDRNRVHRKGRVNLIEREERRSMHSFEGAANEMLEKTSIFTY